MAHGGPCVTRKCRYVLAHSTQPIFFVSANHSRHRVQLSSDQQKYLERFYDPELESISVAIRFLIRKSMADDLSYAQGLTGDLDYPRAMPEQGKEPTTDLAQTAVPAVQAVPENLDSSKMGDGVGKGEPEGETLRKGQKKPEPEKRDPYASKKLDHKLIPDELQPVAHKIAELYLRKKGAHSKDTAERLFNKLRPYPKDIQLESLQRAIDAGWTTVYPESINKQPTALTGKVVEMPHTTNAGAGKLYRASEQPQIKCTPPPPEMGSWLLKSPDGGESLAS